MFLHEVYSWHQDYLGSCNHGNVKNNVAQVYKFLHDVIFGTTSKSSHVYQFFAYEICSNFGEYFLKMLHSFCSYYS